MVGVGVGVVVVVGVGVVVAVGVGVGVVVAVGVAVGVGVVVGVVVGVGVAVVVGVVVGVVVVVGVGVGGLSMNDLALAICLEALYRSMLLAMAEYTGVYRENAEVRAGWLRAHVDAYAFADLLTDGKVRFSDFFEFTILTGEEFFSRPHALGPTRPASGRWS